MEKIVENFQNNERRNGENFDPNPMFYLYYEQKEFKELLFKGSDTGSGERTRRLVFKFYKIEEGGVLKNTLGIWAGKNKIEYYSKGPLILKITEFNIPQFTESFFIGDFQVKRKDFVAAMKQYGSGKTYLIFIPKLFTHDVFQYLGYRVVFSNDLKVNDPGFIPLTGFFDLRDPSPPADTDSD